MDPQPQTVPQVKILFRLVSAVPPKTSGTRSADVGIQPYPVKSNKVNKVKLDLRLEIEPRRPLSPLPNTASHIKVIEGRNTLSRSESSCESHIPENDAMDFENIDEGTLPMVADNCDEVAYLHTITRSKRA